MNISPSADPTKQPQHHAPLCAKGIAAALGVSLDYVYAMQRAGAPFWGRVSTVAAILEWWRNNPHFRRAKARRVRVAVAIQGENDTRRETARSGVIRIL